MAAEDADESNVRPDRIVGSFVDADESIVPLLTVIGKVVVAVAGLEKAMQLELTRLMCEDHGNKLETATGTLGAELDSLSKLPGGELLRRLKDRSLTEDLASRIDDAIKRRNRLVHHLFEDAELAKAIVGGGDLDAVIGRLERLALDCAELCVELQLFAVPRLEALLGTTRGGMIDALRSIDCQLLENSRDRELVEMIQSLANVDELASALGVLEGVSPPTTEWPEPAAKARVESRLSGLLDTTGPTRSVLVANSSRERCHVRSPRRRSRLAPNASTVSPPQVVHAEHGATPGSAHAGRVLSAAVEFDANDCFGDNPITHGGRPPVIPMPRFRSPARTTRASPPTTTQARRRRR